MKEEKIVQVVRHRDGSRSGMSKVNTNFDFTNLIRKIKIAKLYGIELDKNYNRVNGSV